MSSTSKLSTPLTQPKHSRSKQHLLRASLSADSFDKESRYHGGVIDGGVRHGLGEYEYKIGGNGLFDYKGEYTHGIKNAKRNGRFIIKGVSEYIGDFDEHGEITGHGCRYWVDGKQYEGEWKLGEMDGKGIWKLIDNNNNNTIIEMYEGTYVSNQRHGYGMYRKGIDTYKGSYNNNKMNGIGTYLRENKFVIEHGDFNDNIIQGKVIINWSKLAYFTGYMINGRIQNDGIYYTFDKSYDYDGPFINGLPVYDNMSNYIHCELDRSMIIVDEPAAPIDPKAKGKVDPKAPVINDIIIKQGQAVGKITVLSGHGLTIEEIQAAIDADANAPVDPKAKGKQEFVPPTNPKPELHAMSHEKLRTVMISLQDDIGESYSLWMKKHDALKMIYSHVRFSPSTILYIDGISYTKKPRKLSDGRHVSVDFKLEGDAVLMEKNESRNLKDLYGIATPLGSSSSITFQGEELPGSSDLLTFLTDFKLDYNKILELIEANAMANNNNEEYHRVCVMTLSRSLDDIEIKNSRLEFSLLIPRNGITLVELVLDGDNDDPVLEEKTDDEQDKVDKAFDCVISNCIWELTLIKPVEVINDSNILQSDIINDNPDDKDINNDNPEDSEFLADTVDALNEVNEVEPLAKITSESVVCARWYDSKFISSNWHSVALTIKNGDNIVDIAINGTGKMRSISNEIISVSDDEGSVLAWLPEKEEKINEKTLEEGQLLEGQEAEQAAVKPNIKMIYRVGSDSFCGIVKTLSISTHLDREDVWEMTKCYSLAMEEDRAYAQETAHRKRIQQKADRGELDPLGFLDVKIGTCSDLSTAEPILMLTSSKASVQSKLNSETLLEIPWDGVSPLLLKMLDADVPIGDLTIPVGGFDFKTKKVLKIVDKPLENTNKGLINLEITFRRSWMPVGTLHINLISCSKLINMDFGKGSGVSDPYVFFNCGPNSVESRHLMNDLNPDFHQWLELPWDGREPLKIRVMDGDVGKADDFLGETEIILKGFDFSNDNTMSISNRSLNGENTSNNPNSDDKGTINLNIKFTRTKVLNHIPSTMTPTGFVSLKEVPLSLVCGSGDIDSIFIPIGIPPGDYFLVISDGVRKECIYSIDNKHAIKSKPATDTNDSTAMTTNINDLDKLNPGDVENMYMIVEPIQPYKIPIKIIEQI